MVIEDRIGDNRYQYKAYNLIMKSKHNSNDRMNVPHKLSMLLKNPNTKNQLNSVPSYLDANAKVLDLSNNKISQLSGIQKYKSLQVLILSNNAIQDADKLKSLRMCSKIKQVRIDDNPICNKVNYMYKIMCVLNRVIMINGIKLQLAPNIISEWQLQNGKRVYQFLLQSCVILNQLSKKMGNLDMDQVREQLHMLKQQFMNNDKQTADAKIIESINNKITQTLPLKTVQIPQYSSEELNEINEYLMQKLIAIGTQQNSDLILKLLQGVEVSNDQEEMSLIKKPQIAQLILKQQLQRQSILNYQLSLNADQLGRNKKQIGIKHLTSADTALDTLDTAKRDANYYLHFSLDIDYLRVLNQVIYWQIDRLISVIDKSVTQVTQNTVSIQTFKIKYLHPHYKSSDTFEQAQVLNSENRIYNNTVILTNIVQMLENTIKRISMRKLKNTKSYQLKFQTFQFISNSLQRSLNKIFFGSFKKIVENYKLQTMLIQQLNFLKTKKIFNAWKLVKLRKLKLLQKIVKRKVKNSEFLTAISMARWKMNTRSQKIKRRASLALLSSVPKVIPSSKKEIDLAYLRVMKNKLKVL